MKNLTTVGAALLLSTTAAYGAGLDRSGQGVGIIFEEGNVAELSFGVISPSVSGEATGPGLTGESGNMAPSYITFGFGVKSQISDQLSLSLIFDQPYGADVNYANSTGGYYGTGSTADVTASAITAVGRYNINENMSVHAGVRRQTVEASVAIPAGGYDVVTEPDTSIGYLVGAAYERPDIALRVALTYNSAIEHDLETLENGALPSTSTVQTPESFNLDFQTGVAADTLVFGNIRYAKWSQFDFAPVGYAAGNGGDSLQSYDEDTISYSFGVGRRFSDEWSGALTVGYEAEQGGFVGNLAPTDGNMSFGIGGTYTGDGFKVTSGVRYIMLGDGDTEHPVVDGITGAEFRDNTAMAVGVKLTTSF